MVLSTGTVGTKCSHSKSAKYMVLKQKDLYEKVQPGSP